MKTSIRAKVLPLSIVGILFTGLVLGYVAVRTQKSTLGEIYNKEIQVVQKIYNNLENNDIRMLETAMTDIMTNQGLKDTFIEGVKNNNREALLAATQELYAKHKELGVTHFYFHRADGTNFLRVHTPATFDDVITRSTFKKSQATNDWGTGIELGKTAFALRVVHPYYNGADLIGYLEYGEEIDHFNKTIKEQTGDDVVTIVNKAKIDEKGWADLMTKKGMRNNYADMTDFVAIDSTNPAYLEKANYCWNENVLKNVSNEGGIFGLITKNGKTYSCGGFALKDANNATVGAVVSIKDVTADQASLIAGINQSIMLTVVIVLVLSLLILMMINGMIVRPLRKLTDAGNKISEGQIDAALPVINSNDEIKDLSVTMESLVGAIKFMKNKK